MSLNKKKMVREIGRRTRLKNRDVQAVIETLIEVWTEELIAGGRIELEGFLTIRTKPTASSQPMTKENNVVCKRIAINTGSTLQRKLSGNKV